MNEDFLQRKLLQRKEQNAFRKLILTQGKIDFCSNDYLGIARNKLPSKKNNDAASLYASGATGSRLLSGNYALIEQTEQFIANFHCAETALIFNSGYDANLGLLSCVPQRGDTILYDSLSHASIRDGIRLSFAESFSFLHNDLNDLEEKLKRSNGNLFVITESVFSMDGDLCPLNEMVELCNKYEANLIIDEAHATGVVGERGEGLVQVLGQEKNIFARVHTFGKACGVHGAAILGSSGLKDYLINFSRSFIYSTALPEQAIAHIKKSYELFPGMKKERAYLNELISDFQREINGLEVLHSSTPIQGIVIPGNEKVRAAAAYLQQNNLDIRPILYPTVPREKERLRIIFHSFNTPEEVSLLVKCLKNSV